MCVKIKFVSFSFVYVIKSKFPEQKTHFYLLVTASLDVRLELDSLLCLFDRFAKKKRKRGKKNYCPVIYKFSCQTRGLDLTCAITNGLCQCLEERENTGNK